MRDNPPVRLRLTLLLCSLAVLASCGPTPVSPPGSVPALRSSEEAVVSVVYRSLGEELYAVDGQEQTAEQILKGPRNTAKRAVIEVGSDPAPTPFWELVSLLSYIDTENLVVRFPNGRESTLPMGVSCLCSAIEFYDGGKAFGGHLAPHNYVIVELEFDDAGQPVVQSTYHDDRRVHKRGTTGVPPDGWDRDAPVEG